MDYRDWGRGDLARRARYPTDAWDDAPESSSDSLSSLLADDGLRPGGPYAPSSESYSTPSRRRGASYDDADRYTPAWASKPEAVPAPRGGRHRGDLPESGDEAPADENWRGYRSGSLDTDSPTRRESTETATSWQRVKETSDRRREPPAVEPPPVEREQTPLPGSIRSRDTSGGLLGLRDPLPGDPPQVGRRRAAEDDDPPVEFGRRRGAIESPPGTRNAAGRRSIEGPARTAADGARPSRATEGRSRQSESGSRRSESGSRQIESGRRRALDGQQPLHDGDAERRIAADEDRTTGSVRRTETGRRRVADDWPIEAPAGPDSGAEPTARGRRRAEFRPDPVRPESDLDPERAAVRHDGDRPKFDRDGRRPGPESTSRRDRATREVRQLDQAPPTRRWDRPDMDSRSWDRPVRDGVQDPPGTDLARESATVEPPPAQRKVRRTTYRSRQGSSPEAAYPPTRAGWDDPVAERELDDRDHDDRDHDDRDHDDRDHDDRGHDDRDRNGDGRGDRDRNGDGRGDRRGRFIEASGWGRTADTTEWKLAATDDRLYRSPDGPRRDRTGEQGRRAKAADGERRPRSETQSRVRPIRDAATDRRDPDRRDPDRGTLRRDPDGGTFRSAERPTSSAAGWDRPTSSAAGWDRPTSSAPGWGRSTDTGVRDTGHWDRSDETGQWIRSTDTGQFDRFTDTGQLDGVSGTGQWDRFTDTTEWSHGLIQRDDADGRADGDGGETFWSGTRLAGDDPRWMDAPASAPRSPAVAYSSPPRSNPTRPARPGRVSTSDIPARTTVRTGYANRSGLDPAVSSRRWTAQRIEDDLLDADPGSPLAAVLYAAAWYALPVLVFFVWLLTLDGSAPVGCVTDVTGGGCESARAKATASLLGAAPRFGLAMMVSLVTAVLLRWASPTWKSRSVGLAAAVIGGGMSTVLVSVISGQALG